MKREPLTDESGEVRELTREDFRAMRPAAEVLPPELVAILPKRKPGQRGPQRTPVKMQVSLRLDKNIVAGYKATGPGWRSLNMPFDPYDEDIRSPESSKSRGRSSRCCPVSRQGYHRAGLLLKYILIIILVRL